MSENIKKSSKVEASEVKMKPLTKAELMVKFKALEERSDKLVEENQTLRVRLTSLESSKQQIAKETIENETQTIEIDADNEIEESFNCKTCGFEADDIYDLDAHWFSTKCGDSLIACHFCEMNFQTKSDLMKHRKHNHPEKVNICQNFLGVGCNLGEDACWFSHKTTTINRTHICRILNAQIVTNILETNLNSCTTESKIIRKVFHCVRKELMEHVGLDQKIAGLPMMRNKLQLKMIVMRKMVMKLIILKKRRKRRKYITIKKYLKNFLE